MPIGIATLEVAEVPCKVPVVLDAVTVQSAPLEVTDQHCILEGADVHDVIGIMICASTVLEARERVMESARVYFGAVGGVQLAEAAAPSLLERAHKVLAVGEMVRAAAVWKALSELADEAVAARVFADALAVGLAIQQLPSVRGSEPVAQDACAVTHADPVQELFHCRAHGRVRVELLADGQIGQGALHCVREPLCECAPLIRFVVLSHDRVRHDEPGNRAQQVFEAHVG
mmetsp:Transcript_77183/g.236162  ORF Transcript_77183/g.236162 Transcript_77183/m.236162 type:complete len:230 (-) Transcript_77183:154-843(-)